MNDVSQFDPASFLDARTTEQSTRRPPLPAGLELPATISDINSRTWTSHKDPSNPRSGVALDVKLQVSVPPDLVAAGQPPQVLLNDSIMLDLTPSNQIDYSPGRNSRLRLYREATGLNSPGSEFAPRMLVGRTVKVRIGHRPYQGELYEEVAAVGRA